MWCIALITLHMLNHSCECGMHPTWSWCVIFHVLLDSVAVLLRFFSFMFIKDWHVIFFCDIFFSVFVLRVMVAS